MAYCAHSTAPVAGWCGLETWCWRLRVFTAFGRSGPTVSQISTSTSERSAMRSLLCGVAVAALLASSGGASAAPPADLDAFVAKSMQTFGPPGMSVAVVENG